MMTTLWRPVCLTAVGLLSLSGCGLVGQKIVRGSVPDSITVTSPAFRDGAIIPERFACKEEGGQGKTPPLRWSVGSAGAVGAQALVVDDPDAPTGAYVHWVLFNIDATANEILEGVVPRHAEQALNTSDKAGYAPPCPPKGEQHRYRFTVYALRDKVRLPNGAKLNKVLAEIAERTVARGRMTVRFGTGKD